MNCFLPAKDATWNVKGRVILVAWFGGHPGHTQTPWHATWPAPMANICITCGAPLLLLGGRSVLFIMRAIQLFQHVLPYPTEPALRIFQPTCLANDHKFLITTFRSLGLRAVSPAVG